MIFKVFLSRILNGETFIFDFGDIYQPDNMENIEQYYDLIKDRMTSKQFEDLVLAKIESWEGLCDFQAACKLVLSDLGYEEIKKVKDIHSEDKTVVFQGKVEWLGELRRFEREGREEGRVVNILVSDETGSVTLVLWDDFAELVYVGEIEVGDVLKIRGDARDGYHGVEVNIGKGGRLEKADDEDVGVKRLKINELLPDLYHANLKARVLEVGEARTFEGRNGPGEVRTLTIGDETGKVRIALWNEMAKDQGLKVGDSILVLNARSSERYGTLELSLGREGAIEKLDDNEKVEFTEKITMIEDLVSEGIVTVVGEVSGIGEIREFLRPSGEPGKVFNIHLSDRTGRIRIMLWNDVVDDALSVDFGDRCMVVDGAVKVSREGEFEVHVDWRSRFERG